jgi:hypothetical protein
MYKQYLKTIDNPWGIKVISKIDIPARQPIMEMTGNLLETLDRQDPNLCLQVSNVFHIGPSGDVDDQINHSCNPNCYLHIAGVRAILYSLFTIKAGTELTFDYSLSSTDTYDTWKMDCKCMSYDCRKVISGFQYLSDEIKEKYKKLGIVPIFLTEKAFQGW